MLLKKRIMVVALCFTMVFGLVGCGVVEGKESYDVEALQQRIEELEAENEELKEELEEYSAEEENASEGIQFADVNFEKYIRKLIGKLGGEITKEDLEKITYLRISKYTVKMSYDDIEYGDFKTSYFDDYVISETDHINNDGTYNSDYDWDADIDDYLAIYSLEDLKYFTNLQYLDIRIDSGNTEFLNYLTNLKGIKVAEDTVIGKYVKENRPELLVGGMAEGAATDQATTEQAATEQAAPVDVAPGGATTEGATTEGATTEGATTEGATTQGATTEKAETDQMPE